MKTGITAAYGCPAACRGPNTLKKRNARVSRPKDSWYASVYCSVASLLTAYGLIGRTHSRSPLGRAGFAPYTELDDAAIRWGTPARHTSSSRVSVPVALAA